MVSQEFSKESTSSVVHQCHISSMDTCPVHSEDLCYGLQFQSNGVPLCFQPLGEQIYRPEDTEMVTRCLMNREAQRENSCQGFGYGHGLSLTLGFRLPSDIQKDRQANVMCCNYLSNQSDEYMICEGETNNGVYTSNPSNPTLHGMASIVTVLQNSPYMKPAQQLLDEVVCVSNAVEPGSDRQAGSIGRAMRSDGRSLCVGERTNRHEGNHYSSEEKREVQNRITKLVALLDELENRYDYYFHQMDRVVSSFEMVAGIGAAAPYTALTIQAMSKHFSNLRDAIVAQLNVSRDSLSEDLPRNHGGHSPKKMLSLKKRETLQHLGMVQIRQVWRPLRGLPEDSVALLRAWLFEHFLHPYPSDKDKLTLASQTGLTRNQISNWFINARVRLWKPMIEEMYREEFAEDLHDSNLSC